MWDVGRKPVLFADIPWYEALDHPGAFQMGLLRRLFTRRTFQTLRPAPELMVDGPRHGGAKIRAACAEDGSFTIIYSPRGPPADRSLTPQGYLVRPALWERTPHPHG